ncbi:cobyrinate a,c-diamide synthase [Cohnella xylanilytica]|uniref:cobyrinate a,c-diamide synthase n=1 Tax=Cohnella xylanilytica TaxID=557555 RepID=UPI001B1E0494|nr:cobyrinate a,c-diamide synthase [Cohnella xylanilytica]GIO12532.1 cobyrinate a,c-diamide synthase [Cohnella xylanilytica]
MAARWVVAGTGSGVGKTTVAIGLMAALRRRGLAVQGFKCGPDYIDPTYHASVTGRVSRNLDSWMFGEDGVREIFARGGRGADISVIEGVMGLYDGRDSRSDEGSSADIARIVDAPILLVVNCQSMARSAAAVVKGFQCFAEEGRRIAGVVANKVGSEGHYKLVKEAIERECGVPVLGWMARETDVEMPERHLGLVPSIERGELAPMFARLAEKVEANFELGRLLELGERPPMAAEPKLFAARPESGSADGSVIAVAKDAAFHFYYPENLELLELYGARCVFFSPLAGETVPPEADGLYIGGGFPEEFAERLAAHAEVAASIRDRVRSGMPTLAECGGYMYLTESLETTDGARYPMVGLVPGCVRMRPKLAALGYREAAGTPGNFLLGPGETARGHEFHYSVYEAPEGEEPPYAYETKGLRGTKREGFVRDRLVAGYTHLHFASNPEVAGRFAEACRQYKSRRGRI